jgi:hypothetical protein
MEYGVRKFNGFIWFWRGPAAVTCENVNANSGSIKRGEFFVQLSDYHLLNRDSAA